MTPSLSSFFFYHSFQPFLRQKVGGEEKTTLPCVYILEKLCCTTEETKSRKMEWQPYIFFNGQAREALTFYKDCFGGEVEFKTFEGTPIANDVPEDYRSNILHSSLQIKGKTVLMASDAMSPKSEGAKFEGFSVSINFDSEEKCDQAFERISAGGKITAPLQLQFWGDKFGEVTDKFNVSWMIHYQPNSDPPSKKMKTNLTPITDNVLFNVIAREWRMKWSADESKASLSKVW